MAERESIMRKMNGFGMMAKRGTAAAMAAAMALTMAGCGGSNAAETTAAADSEAAALAVYDLPTTGGLLSGLERLRLYAIPPSCV